MEARPSQVGWGKPTRQAPGDVRKLRGDLLHYNAESIDRQIAKISGFSSDFVRHQQATGRRATWPDLVLRPAWRFVRSYFIRAGFLDGWQGWYIAWMTAFQTATRYAKVREAALVPPPPPHSLATSK